MVPNAVTDCLTLIAARDAASLTPATIERVRDAVGGEHRDRSVARRSGGHRMLSRDA